MLIELYGKNFGCFRDEFHLSMLATDIDPGSDRGVVEVKVEGDDEPLRLLRAVALYGANASGKSTVVRAAEALSRLLLVTKRLRSESPLRSYEPHALGPQSKQAVSLGSKAVIDGAVYDYAVSFDRTAVLSEKLSRLSGEAPLVLFSRTRQEVTGAWRQDPQFELFSNAFRPNASLLALADTLTPKLAKSIAVGFRRVLVTREMTPRMWPFDPAEDVAERAQKHSAFGGWLLERLQTADIGVVGLRPEEVRRTVRVIRADADSGEEEGPVEEAESSWRLTLVHGGPGQATPLPYSRESLGTRRLVELSPMLYDLTHERAGGAIFVDEFDASIHPLLLEDLVRHFNCDIKAEAVRGQLIFTTHESKLMDDEAKDAVLRRDQIYFTEKDASGASRLYSLGEFRERNNLNIRRRYLQGRYGALPSLGIFTEP